MKNPAREVRLKHSLGCHSGHLTTVLGVFTVAGAVCNPAIATLEGTGQSADRSGMFAWEYPRNCCAQQRWT
jgi:hypothetical protein